MQCKFLKQWKVLNNVYFQVQIDVTLEFATASFSRARLFRLIPIAKFWIYLKPCDVIHRQRYSYRLTFVN